MNNSGGAGPTGIRRGEEWVSDAVVVEECDEEDWDPDAVMTAAEANGTGLRGRFCELQNECPAEQHRGARWYDCCGANGYT